MFGFFRRKPPIRDLDSLAEFIDQQSAFLVQKGIYEYSRARAGHYAKVLFGEKEFQDAVEQSRWRAYPLGLAMVAELVEGALRPEVGDARRAALDALIKVTLAIFDRYPQPAVLDAATWSEARATLAHQLDLIGTHAPKPAKDIPEVFTETYFALMPIHEKLRGRDFATTRNYLRVTMCNIHDELVKRVDAPAVAGQLRAQTG